MARARRRLTDEERAERRAAERELMERAVEELRSSEGWQRWLSLRHLFHRYSFRNQILIATQRPTATRVAGYERWRKLGYQVRRGERGIAIWARCTPSKKALARWREEGADPEKRPRGFYRMVKVFDRAQVEPIPDADREPVDLDPPIVPLEGDQLAGLFAPLCAFAREVGVTAIEVEEIAGPARGYFNLLTEAIGVEPVSPAYSPNQRVKTLVHELAHALLHFWRKAQEEAGENAPALSREAEEVVVECVAFTVCAAVGFDSAGYSVPYVTSWSEGEEIERFGELIDGLARRIEDVALAALHDPGPGEAAAMAAVAA